ncbi:MAG: nucleotidyltransferase domain-containing protein [Candidatus Aenigmatarchaeota archaeon]|nr:MAG: nucleotidyltransferase domain-containing protein [Candidatus Aenigmarchaeota archaeon]
MKILKRLVETVKKDKDVLAVLVFGSYARGERYSDIDVCIVLKEKMKNLEMSRKKLYYISSFPLDIHIFQQLPLYIRIRVLKEGKVIYCKDMDLLYDTAIKTIKEFEDYKHIYYSYLEGVLNG